MVALVELLAAAKPWTYWIAPVVFLVSILGVLSLFVRYLLKVVGAKYPKQQ
jgi:uncharacterized membrane protein